MPPSKTSKSKVSKTTNYEFLSKLAANDRPTRDNALKSLIQVIKTPSKMDDLELQKLWKGLFFTMWHSDRPRTQQKLAQDMADMVLVVKKVNFANFVSAFWKVMAREWDSIDKHRVDKFYLLMRRYVGATLLRLKQEQWADQWMKAYQQIMSTTALNPSDQKIPNGIRMHVCDVLLDEIERNVLVETEDNDSTSDDDTADSADYSEYPLNDLLKPAQELMDRFPVKFMRNYVKQNVFEDPRLVKWSVVEPPAEEEPEPSDDDEWAGFE